MKKYIIVIIVFIGIYQSNCKDVVTKNLKDCTDQKAEILKSNPDYRNVHMYITKHRGNIKTITGDLFATEKSEICK